MHTAAVRLCRDLKADAMGDGHEELFPLLSCVEASVQSSSHPGIMRQVPA